MFRYLLSSLLVVSLSSFANEKAQEIAKDMGLNETEMGQVLILGEAEWVYVKDVNKNLKARIDTGATTSSISAKDISSVKEKGKQRIVTFRLAHKDWSSELMTLPVKRRVKVKQSSSDTPQSRYVVELPIQIGNHKVTSEFTLVDRSRLTYPVLIGRTFIKNNAIVDVGHRYIQPINEEIKQEEVKPAEKSLAE